MTIVIAGALAVLVAGAQTAPHRTAQPAPHQTAKPTPHGGKHQMDKRGHHAMGFVQDMAQHTFSILPDGGVIDIQARGSQDTVTIGQIRAHLKEIARLFKEGNFDKPVYIHEGTPPGAGVMKARAADLTYAFEEIPAGGKLRITAADRAVVDAVHQFLKYQQQEHK